MRNLVLIAMLMGLAACASVRKVELGTNKVGERLTVHIDGAWNHLDSPGIKPAQIWTMEGVTIDELLIYSGIRDGEAIHAGNAAGSKKKNVVFRSGMQIEEMVAMFGSVLTHDDSAFKLTKVEPYPFGGKKGFRFEYERIRKVDNVQQLGMGYGAIDNGELFAMVYQAPRLTFFTRHRSQVESMARTVLIN